MKNSRRYILDGRAKNFLAAAGDGIGYALLRPRRGGPIDRERIGKILLVRLDHIGDLLMTTPAIRALRKSYPEAEIHLLIKEATREAVELNPRLDRVIVLDAPWTSAAGKKAAWPEVFKTARRLGREGYDCVLGFRPDFREALLVKSTGAPVRIGHGERGGGFCFTRPVPFDHGRHEILRALDLLSPLGVVPDGGRMEIFLSPEDREEAGSLLSGIGRRTGEKLVGIHPGAASPFKRWRPEGFSRLGDLLAGKNFRIVLLGAASERELLESIATGMRIRPPVVFPDGIRTLAALIENLDCLICNDSAPSHIAQAMRTRAVVLYGPTYDEVTGPLDRNGNRVIRNPVSCSPCWLPGREFRCEYDFRCWEGLSADPVVEEVAATCSRGLQPAPGERTLKGAATAKTENAP